MTAIIPRNRKKLCKTFSIIKSHNISFLTYTALITDTLEEHINSLFYPITNGEFHSRLPLKWKIFVLFAPGWRIYQRIGKTPDNIL
jgi:hypothetical protein